MKTSRWNADKVLVNCWNQEVYRPDLRINPNELNLLASTCLKGVINDAQ